LHEDGGVSTSFQEMMHDFVAALHAGEVEECFIHFVVGVDRGVVPEEYIHDPYINSMGSNVKRCSSG
jgi:hypothetical protein